MAKPIVCNLFNSLNTARLNTEMGILVFFDFGIGIIGFFCFTFRYRYFTVFGFSGIFRYPSLVYSPLMRPSVRLSVCPSQLKGFQNFEK